MLEWEYHILRWWCCRLSHNAVRRIRRYRCNIGQMPWDEQIVQALQQALLLADGEGPISSGADLLPEAVQTLWLAGSWQAGLEGTQQMIGETGGDILIIGREQIDVEENGVSESVVLCPVPDAGNDFAYAFDLELELVALG